MNKNEMYIGIDYGGYDGNTFCMCAIKDGETKLLKSHNEEEFKEEVMKVVRFYKTSHILIERHQKFESKKLDI